MEPLNILRKKQKSFFCKAFLPYKIVVIFRIKTLLRVKTYLRNDPWHKLDTHQNVQLWYIFSKTGLFFVLSTYLDRGSETRNEISISPGLTDF